MILPISVEFAGFEKVRRLDEDSLDLPTYNHSDQDTFNIELSRCFCVRTIPGLMLNASQRQLECSCSKPVSEKKKFVYVYLYQLFLSLSTNQVGANKLRPAYLLLVFPSPS